MTTVQHNLPLAKRLLAQAANKAGEFFDQGTDAAAAAAADAFLGEVRQHRETLFIANQCGSRRFVIALYKTSPTREHFEKVLNCWAIRY